MVRVKICGVCRPGDAAEIAAAGADYLGVILVPGRARSRSPREAAAIYAAAPQCSRVGVFVDAAPYEVCRTARRLGLDVVQLHGSESAAEVAAVRDGDWSVWKVLRPRDAAEFLAGVEQYADLVDALLLDGWSAVAPGGVGARFPWEEVGAVRDAFPARVTLVVAGGLGPANVADAIAALDPDVVDVSSGVEVAPGTKDPELVRRFITAARTTRDGANV